MADVFCDWLDVTCSPEDSFYSDVYDWCIAGFPVCFSDDRRVVFDVGRQGKIVLDDKPRFHRVSASGAALARLRGLGVYGEYLTLLSSVPMAVTRLDAALDVSVDAPVVLRGLEARYADDYVNLTRKALRVTKLYSRRPDGQDSGTWYAGHRSKARVTARVYDKQLQAYEVHGEIIGPTTRYELTFRKDIGCTLRDAYMPRSLFYEYASPTLVETPPDHYGWEPHGDPWVGEPVDTDITYEVFLRRVENSPELQALETLAVRLGPVGVDMYVKALRRKLVIATSESVDVQSHQ